VNDALFVASTLGNTVEQVGAYGGLASMIGLGVLALLYFAQAREVKRLREWAGRAPERAAEVEQRVLADAQRRVIAQPQTPAGQVAATPAGATPAARLPTAGLTGEPATRAAAAAIVAARATHPSPAVGPAGQLARPSLPPADTPATQAPGSVTQAPGSVPQAPGSVTQAPGSVPQAPGSVTQAPGSVPQAPGSVPQAPGSVPQAPGSVPQAPGSVPPASAAPASAASPSPEKSAPATPQVPKPANPAASAPASAAALAANRPTATASSPPAEAAKPRVVAQPPAAANGAGQETRESAAARPLPPPPAPPPPPAAKPPPDDGAGWHPGRTLAIIGGVLGLVLVVGLIVMLAGGDDPAPSTRSTIGTVPKSQPEQSEPSSSGQAASVARGDTTTTVLNGTTQAGLASTVQTKLTDAGFKRGEVSDNVDQTLSETAVYFTAGNERAAKDVAKVIGISSSAVQPEDRNVDVATSGADVVVTVGADLSE